MAWERDYRRDGATFLISLACAASTIAIATIAWAATGERASPAPPHSRTLGLVLTSWRNGLVETPDAKEECSLGLQPGEVAQLKASPGAVERLKQFGGAFELRGVNGETGGYSPLTVEDPLPFSEVKTKSGYGVNLDGTPDGHATAKTCKHEKFTNTEGEKVDNQLARVIGCVMGYRTGGQMAEFRSNETVTTAINRQLIEVTGVDDEVNDPAVEVMFYKGMDRLVRSSDNKFVPDLSQRIDPRFPKYNMKTRGKIVNGVLITDPIPEAVLPFMDERNIGDRNIRDLTLRLKLNSDGAEGILAGYDHWGHWYNIHAKRVVPELGKFSSPSIYKALMRYADGYPDPATGQCAYISATYKVTAVRAFIVHRPEGQSRNIIAQK